MKTNKVLFYCIIIAIYIIAIYLAIQYSIKSIPLFLVAVASFLGMVVEGNN